MYSEADGLSGLIVDRYGEWLSIQVTALAMARRLDELVDTLEGLVHPRGVFIRTEKGVSSAEGIELGDGLFRGEAPDGPVFIVENGLRYGVDLAEGQKTGFYLDQRDNRRAAAGYLRGRTVLDMFSYSGGFGLNASMHGGRSEVLGFDASQKAVALARANAELNGVTNVQFRTSRTVSRRLNHRRPRREVRRRDPRPAQVYPRRDAVPDALRAYHRLNRLAVGRARARGHPGHVQLLGPRPPRGFSGDAFGRCRANRPRHPGAGNARRSGRSPAGVTCLEGEYLKCFICRVV